jgi:hypothetical protein
MHIHIAEAALDWLAGDCAAFWKPLRKIVAKASNYPDYFAADSEKNEQIDPDWREYTMIPEADNTIVHSIIKPLKLRETYPPIIKHWTAQTIASIKSGDNERAAKFIGCLSHLIGDTGQAAHTFDERLLKKLLPQGDKRFIFHSTMERVMGKIEAPEYDTKFLGGSIKELNWRLIEELEILKQRNTAEVIPLLKAIMDGDNTAAEASASRSITLCAELFADLLVSIWNIASGEKDGLKNEFELQNLVPVDQACDMLFNYEIMIDRIPGKTVNKALMLNLGAGDVHGIALLADMAPFFKGVRRAFVEYSIPAGVFKYFESEVGLNHYSVNETKAVFEVKLDGKTVFTSEALGKDDSGLRVKIELGDAERLQLYVRDARPAPDGTKFFYPLFANPKLIGRI